MSDEHDHARQREQAAQDLADISELSRTQGFTRYWLRRLRVKREAMATAFKNDTMTYEARESLRQRILMIEEIEKMPALDEGTIRATAQTISLE